MPKDFFLSYATLDDEPAIPGVEASRWVSTFRQALTGRVQFFLRRKAQAFFDCADLHGNAGFTQALESARKETERPTLIVAKTFKGKGVSFMENQIGWHGVAPNKEQLEKALHEVRGGKPK